MGKKANYGVSGCSIWCEGRVWSRTEYFVGQSSDHVGLVALLCFSMPGSVHLVVVSLCSHFSSLRAKDDNANYGLPFAAKRICLFTSPLSIGTCNRDCVGTRARGPKEKKKGRNLAFFFCKAPSLRFCLARQSSTLFHPYRRHQKQKQQKNKRFAQLEKPPPWENLLLTSYIMFILTHTSPLAREGEKAKKLSLPLYSPNANRLTDLSQLNRKQKCEMSLLLGSRNFKLHCTYLRFPSLLPLIVPLFPLGTTLENLHTNACTPSFPFHPFPCSNNGKNQRTRGYSSDT